MPIYRDNRKIIKIYRDNKAITGEYKDNIHISLSGGGGTPLPEGLQEVEYLEGYFGGMRISLLEQVTIRDLTYKLKVLVSSSSYSSQYKSIISITGQYDSRTLYYTAFTNRLMSSSYSDNYGIQLPLDIATEVTYDTSGNYYRDGVFIANKKAQSSYTEIAVVLSHYSDTPFRLYKFTVANGSTNKPVLNLIPCYDTNSEVPCFYNKVTKEIINVPADIVAGPPVNS